MSDGESSPARRARGRPRGWNDKTEQNTIKSLDRAMEVFEHLSTLPGATLTELSEELSQSPATVYRIMVTLEGRGLVEFDQTTQMWHVGARAFVIGARYLRRTSLVERARPVLRQLMEDTGETANLGIARDTHVLFVGQVETHATIRAFFPPGTLSPMHASGIGKALLAQMSDDRLSRLFATAPLDQFTAKTLIEPSTLRADLEATRERGYAIDDEEKNEGMRCIAAPIFDFSGGAIAGLSVSGPVSRVSLAKTEDLAASVVRAAQDLSQAMGAEG
ncbi:HTH-type transcriptional regulator BhcR [Gymnodinialimonas hymeniacidonis]|uniref:HTH-type transcriptional regulator BhcR n=1 Tax=Gymnodinialimonas hymeniacidonis TaxID=3126508 RepID=UPI0034C5ECF1